MVNSAPVETVRLEVSTARRCRVGETVQIRKNALAAPGAWAHL